MLHRCRPQSCIHTSSGLLHPTSLQDSVFRLTRSKTLFSGQYLWVYVLSWAVVHLGKVMEPNMEYIVAQVTQKEVGRRFQVGPEIIDYILDKQKSHDLEHDQSMLDRMVDSLATSWVNASNFKVREFVRIVLVHPQMKMRSPSGHPRCRWVCFFIRFVEMCLCISVSAMDALQWMGAVRMRVQTADKNITIIHK